MRAIWTGSISFGLVNVPVKLYTATEDHDISCNQVHADCGGRIRYLRSCEDCGGVVDYADIAKQYTMGDQSVILTSDDLATIEVDKSKTIEVVEFVPDGSIDPLLYEQSFYLAPQTDSAAKAYKLLSGALAGDDRVAIVTFSLRSKTHLASLRVTGKQNVITLHCLRWPDEIRDAHFPVLDKEVKVSDAELKMAALAIESMFNEFNQDRYKDTYQAELRALIERKIAGDDDQEDVSDLLKKLEKSVKRRKK